MHASKVIELAKEKKIDLSKSVTHKISLDEANKELEILEKKTGNPVRVVIVQCARMFKFEAIHNANLWSCSLEGSYP
jgi:hypothetical protein